MTPTYSPQYKHFFGQRREGYQFEARQFSRERRATPAKPAIGTLTIVLSVIDLP